MATKEKTETKTHWKKQFNYNYLGSYSLVDGKDLVLTIKEFKKEEVKDTKGKKKECFVVRFHEPNIKPMILNKTNCKAVEKLYGSPFIEDWSGKKISIYVTKVDAFGDEVDALRIRDTAPSEIIDTAPYLQQLNDCKTLAELAKTYKSFERNAQENKEIIKQKDELKKILK